MTKKPRERSLALDITTLALWAGALVWLGWQGGLVFFVALMIGGLGTLYNGGYLGGRRAS